MRPLEHCGIGTTLRAALAVPLVTVGRRHSAAWSCQSASSTNRRRAVFVPNRWGRGTQEPLGRGSVAQVDAQVALTSDETRCSEEAMAPLNTSSKQACKLGAVALGGGRERTVVIYCNKQSGGCLSVRREVRQDGSVGGDAVGPAGIRWSERVLRASRGLTPPRDLEARRRLNLVTRGATALITLANGR